MVNHPRPKAGVFAVRQVWIGKKSVKFDLLFNFQGPFVYKNIRSYLLNTPSDQLEDYIPQSQFLGLISCGTKYCLGSRGPLGKFKDFRSFQIISFLFFGY